MPHPQNTQSVKEIVKEYELEYSRGGFGDTKIYEQTVRFLRKALTTAIESERERILKLLPPEKKICQEALMIGTKEYDARLIDIGYNQYRCEVLQALNPKE